MEPKSYLFPIPEIEAIIISFLDPVKDYPKIIQLNKYFYQIISNDEIYSEFNNFFRISDSLKVNIGFEECNKQTLIFLKSCKYDYLLIAKYFYQNCDIDIHINDEYALYLACKYGHIDIVKYLHSCLKNVDIHLLNDEVFCESCIHGHLEIAKFLFHLDDKINIYSVFDYAFTLSRKNGYPEVCEWLESLT